MMAGNGWKLLEWLEMAGNVYKGLTMAAMAEYGREWLGMAGNGWEWLGWLEMAGNLVKRSWEWLKGLEIAGNSWNGWK